MASLTFRVADRTKERFDRLVDELGLNRSHVLRDAISGKLQELEALVEQHRPRRRRQSQTKAPVDAVLQEVRRFQEVEKAYLFGSRAQGDAGKMSDVDIALSCPDIDRRRWEAIAEAVQDAETLLDVDVVWLEEASSSLRDEILRTGKVVYERA
ncbi:MAG: type VII toxin-antitoxin system MntA family adenylyltransferase antitoxin [Geminicoccaceae bacterium]